MHTNSTLLFITAFFAYLVASVTASAIIHPRAACTCDYWGATTITYDQPKELNKCTGANDCKTEMCFGWTAPSRSGTCDISWLKMNWPLGGGSLPVPVIENSDNYSVVVDRTQIKFQVSGSEAYHRFCYTVQGIVTEYQDAPLTIHAGGGQTFCSNTIKVPSKVSNDCGTCTKHCGDVAGTCSATGTLSTDTVAMTGCKLVDPNCAVAKCTIDSTCLETAPCGGDANCGFTCGADKTVSCPITCTPDYSACQVTCDDIVSPTPVFSDLSSSECQKVTLDTCDCSLGGSCPNAACGLSRKRMEL